MCGVGVEERAPGFMGEDVGDLKLTTLGEGDSTSPVTTPHPSVPSYLRVRCLLQYYSTVTDAPHVQ
jgi:hypothetical protein